MILNDARSFCIDVVGATGERYNGVFQAKPLLSHREKLRMDEIRRSLLGQDNGQVANEYAIRIANIFSKIYSHVTVAPAFWTTKNNGLDLLDEEPVMAVLEKVIEIQDEVTKAITKSGEEAKEEIAGKPVMIPIPPK